MLASNSINGDTLGRHLRTQLLTNWEHLPSRVEVGTSRFKILTSDCYSVLVTTDPFPGLAFFTCLGCVSSLTPPAAYPEATSVDESESHVSLTTYRGVGFPVGHAQPFGL